MERPARRRPIACNACRRTDRLRLAQRQIRTGLRRHHTVGWSGLSESACAACACRTQPLGAGYRLLFRESFAQNGLQPGVACRPNCAVFSGRRRHREFWCVRVLMTDAHSAPHQRTLRIRPAPALGHPWVDLLISSALLAESARRCSASQPGLPAGQRVKLTGPRILLQLNSEPCWRNTERPIE